MGSVDFALYNTLWISLIGGVVDKILEFFFKTMLVAAGRSDPNLSSLSKTIKFLPFFASGLY